MSLINWGVKQGVYAIYKRHGWPWSFDRDACKSDLETFLREQDDNFI